MTLLNVMCQALFYEPYIDYLYPYNSIEIGITDISILQKKN